MTDVKGFFYPRTAEGRSSIIPDPPWFYSGDLLTVEYRTNPERVAELLPAPLELAPEDPGAVALIWADWQSCSSSREELLDPVRSQYKEAFVVVRCSFEGRVFSRCVYIWVDKDFAIARGMHQGYPKKLGSMWQTRPHPFAHGAPQIAAGGVFGATLAAGDRRIAEAVLTLREETDVERLRELAPDGASPGLSRHRARRAGRVRRADLLGCRRVRRRTGVEGRCGRATCSSRRPRSSPGSRSRKSSVATTARSESNGMAAPRWRAARRRTDGWDRHERGQPPRCASRHDRGRGRRGRHPALDQRRASRVGDPPSPTSRRSTRRRSARSPPEEPPRSTARYRPRVLPSRPGRRCRSPSAPPSCARVADGIDARAEELSRVETRDNGSLLRSHRRGVMPRVGMNFRYFADWAEQLQHPDREIRGHRERITFDPAGVVAIITPWNAPLMLATWRIGPALAAGNTVVLKPPEWAPLTASLLADIAHEAGLPAGVFNVVQGLGADAGAPLTKHPGINRLSFTGSVPTAGSSRGRRRPTSCRCRSSSVASRRCSCSTTPTSTWRSTSQSSSSTTPARSVSARSGCWSRRASPTSSSTGWSSGHRRSSKATRATRRPT